MIGHCGSEDLPLPGGEFLVEDVLQHLTTGPCIRFRSAVVTTLCDYRGFGKRIGESSHQRVDVAAQRNLTDNLRPTVSYCIRFDDRPRGHECLCQGSTLKFDLDISAGWVLHAADLSHPDGVVRVFHHLVDGCRRRSLDGRIVDERLVRRRNRIPDVDGTAERLRGRDEKRTRVGAPKREFDYLVCVDETLRLERVKYLPDPVTERLQQRLLAVVERRYPVGIQDEQTVDAVSVPERKDGTTLEPPIERVVAPRREP